MNIPKILVATLAFIILNTSVYTQNFNMDGSPILSCSGFFHDSGGASLTYGLNENFTTIICNDGSGASHIRLLFPGIDIGTNDIFRVYDANSADNNFAIDLGFLLSPNEPFILQATAVNLSGCLTIVFESDGIDEGNTGWDAAIDCTPLCQTIEAVLVNTTPSIFPVDTGWIDICPGTEVFFESAGNYLQNNESYIQSDLLSTFEWNFGDGVSSNGIMTSHVFEESGGYIVQLTITDQVGCKSTNFINQRIRVSGSPNYAIDGLDFTVCLGDTIDVSSSIDALSGSNIIAQANVYNFFPTNSVVDTVFLPDGIGVSYQSSVFFTQFPPGAVLENPLDLLGLTLDIEHSYYGDLDIELICPDGTSIYLLNRANSVMRGSTNLGEPWASANIDNDSDDPTPGCGYLYTFVNNSPNGTLATAVSGLSNILLTTKPSIINGDIHQYLDWTFPAGEYQSDTPFSNLLGCPLNGQWTIRVTDHLSRDNGWLFGWEIDFAANLFSNVEVYTPEIIDFDWYDSPTIISSSSNLLTANSPNAGQAQYVFWTQDAFGCRYDTTLVFEILPEHHPDCNNCDLEINDQEDLLLCRGDNLQLNVSSAAVLEECITFQQFPQYAFGAANHPTNTAYASVLNINNIQPGIITNPLEDICAVCIDLSTDELSNIRLVLEAPDGQQIVLIDGLGGDSGLGLVNTCFSPTAITEIADGIAPFTDSFQPQDAWGGLTNSPVNGQWTLWVSDCCDLTQQGELLQWSISFNSTNEYTYSWENNSDLSCLDCDNPVATPIVSNNYRFTVTDSYGCTLEEVINAQIIEDLEEPIVSCNPENNGILFNWSTSSPLDSFEYRLTVNGIAQSWIGPVANTSIFTNTFSHNDTVSLEVRIFVDVQTTNCNIPTGNSECIAFICDLEIGNPTITDASCFNVEDGTVTINVTAGTMPYTYRINGNNADFTAPLITGLTPGDYTYTVINGLGCDVRENFSIGGPDSLFVDIDQTFAACFGINENTAVAVGGGGSGSGYVYTWSNGQLGAEQTPLITGVYQVTIEDSNQCFATNDGTISSLDAINFNFLTNPPSCFESEDGGVGVNQISGGIGLVDEDYLLSWEDGSTDIVRIGLLGSSTYCITVTDTQGCQSEQCRELTEPVSIPLNLGLVFPTCLGDQDGEITILQPFQADLFDIQWSANTGNQTTQTAVGLSAGNYSVIIQDDTGCTATADTILVDPQLLDVSFIVADNDCYDYRQGSLTPSIIGGVPPYQFNWTTGSNNEQITNLAAGSYTLTLTDNNGCEVINSADVKEPFEAIVSTENTPAVCFGDQNASLEVFLLGGTPPFMYSLNNSAFTSNAFFLGLTAGTYSIQVKDNNNCNYFAQTAITEPLEFVIDAREDEHINFGDSVLLNPIIDHAQGIVMYFWSELYPGTLSCLPCQTPFAAPSSTTDYTVLAIDSKGCEAEDGLRVFVEKNYKVAVPTGFTPNNDNANDFLLVHGTPGIHIINFQVFDRWGEEVYIKNDFPINNQIGWDGEFRGEVMNAGVFVWQLQALYPDGSIKSLNGQTTLIR